MLAATESMCEDFSSAESHLQQLIDSSSKAKTAEEHMDSVLMRKRLGDCYWSERKSKQALSEYSAALVECATLPPGNPVTPSLLEAIAGTYEFMKDYQSAEKYAQQLLQIEQERAKSGQLEDLAALFWARIKALDVYRNLGKETERQQLWKDSSGLFDQLLSMRAKLDAANQLPELEAMQKEFEERYIAQYHPKTPGEYLWLASEFKMRTLPLIQWPAANGARAKCAILCIHGLGLDNRSFTDFGREMATRGYSVYALDVRGFGAWQSSQGQEDVHFQETIKDIGSVTAFIKQRENLPVFLLGESMGGAIALRGAAQYNDTLSGVISSVPSAERFQSRRMSLTVAKHILHGGANKPFRVGDIVTDQATKSVDLRERWSNDVKAKMDMSPKELIKFAVFMRTTKKECENIKIPAFLVQGLKDRLVKPNGTYDLFDAIQADDKDMFILGTSEHLIFELYKPYKLLLDALTTWLDEHTIAKPTATSSGQSK
jgi:alpha-beta hydrolase superfamily lysophospholipase